MPWFNKSIHSLHEEFVKESANAILQWHKSILIINNDADVVVLVISFCSEIVAEKLWMTLEKGGKRPFTIFAVPIKSSAKKKTWAATIHGFHALTGCNSTFLFLEQERNWLVSTGQQDQNSEWHCITWWIGPSHSHEKISKSLNCLLALCNPLLT